MASQEQREALDSLAYAHGLELRIEHDESAPLPFAVWCWDPCEDGGKDNADIIGAGESESEAIDAARKQLRIWEANAQREWK
jgi:hypothetical protein